MCNMTLTVWDRISLALKERGKNQSWLAEQLGIERAAVANWKRRGIVPPAKYPDLAVIFGESIDWVAGTGEARSASTSSLSPMALRIAQEFDGIKSVDRRLDAFARCISAIVRASEGDPQTP